MSKWTAERLEDLGADGRAFAMGPFGSRIKTENFRETGIPVLRGGNLVGNRFNDSNVVFLDEYKALELAASIAEPGDLVFTHRGTLGQVAMIPRNAKYPYYIVSQSQMKATLNEQKVLPEFAYYWFCSPQGQSALLRNTSQTGVPAISQPLTSLRSIEMPVPPIDEQLRMVEVLSALDDAIATNERISKVSWTLATAHFDALMTKADEFVPLGSVLGLAYGKALPARSRVPGVIPVFGSGGVVGCHNKPLVSGPGVVIGRKGTAGAVHWCDTDFFPIDTTFYVESPSVPMLFAFLLLRSLGLNEMNSDSAVPGLNRTAALARVVALPAVKSLEEFNVITEPLVETAESADRENRLLFTIRDTLLPRLLNGELQVRDVESFAEESA